MFLNLSLIDQINNQPQVRAMNYNNNVRASYNNNVRAMYYLRQQCVRTKYTPLQQQTYLILLKYTIRRLAAGAAGWEGRWFTFKLALPRQTNPSRIDSKRAELEFRWFEVTVDELDSELIRAQVDLNTNPYLKILCCPYK